MDIDTKDNTTSPAFDHVVVLMLENRSFDNLLGYLYQDGVPDGKSFAGLQEGSFSNPIPSRIKTPEGSHSVEVKQSKDYHQPFPDPGEEYQHINTQLFNHIDKDNLKAHAIHMKPPYNLPAKPPATAPMTGFVNDYINTLQGMGDRTYANPTLDQYQVIMQCFKPTQVPVISTLAREFSVFDHWHCSVPSQTWCNRAFWHSSTSTGFVINPMEEDDEKIYEDFIDFYHWRKKMWHQPTLFSRLNDNNISNKIYSDNLMSLTHLIHGFTETTTAKSMGDFYSDLRGGNLPQYSFIEPKFMGKEHNDQHPSAITTETQAGTVLLGEKLIHEVYSAIRASEKHRDKILFIITHDEHGGCYDHVSPPAAVPPKAGIKGQNNFGFDRLGIRVPMVMVSSYIAQNTIVNDTFDHSSFIHTLSQQWGFEYLTDRDSTAKSFASVFSGKKRSWPEIKAPTLPEGHDLVDYDVHPLNGLQKSILNAAYAIAKSNKSLFSEAQEQHFQSITNVGQAIAFLESIKHILEVEN